MNNEIKEILENENVIYFISDLINEKNDYKSRIEKAVEYIEPFVEFDTDIMFKGKMMAPVLDILNNRSVE